LPAEEGKARGFPAVQFDSEPLDHPIAYGDLAMTHPRFALACLSIAVSAGLTWAFEPPAAESLSSPAQRAQKPGESSVDRFFADACREARDGRKDRALTALQSAAKAGDLSQTRCLTEPGLIVLHEQRPFRDLMRRIARQSEIAMTPPDEPGESLIVSGRVVDDDLKPVKDALIYVFHTNHQGSYSSTGGNATMGDSLNPRLFGYLRTDADGRYQYRTIRPAGYPGDGPPAHVHYEVQARGHETLVTELMFEGDPRLSSENRREIVQAGFVIAEVTKDKDGVQRCVCDLVMERDS
jgi:protocatechuate 3,4-dioxygenase beta subunit